MTPEEFQHWIGDTKIDTSIGYKCRSNRHYDPKTAWKLIAVGAEYWFFNYDFKKGPMGWMKLKVTYKRSGMLFYKVLDDRYKMDDKEECVSIDTMFVRDLHPEFFENPNPKYFKSENFDTLEGRVKII